MNNSHANIIQNLGNIGFLCLRDPEINGFTRGADWTRGWGRESVHILTFTIDHVCDLVKNNETVINSKLFLVFQLKTKDHSIMPSNKTILIIITK